MLLNNSRSKKKKLEPELNALELSPRKWLLRKSRTAKKDLELRLKKASMIKFNREKLALLLEEVVKLKLLMTLNSPRS
jgi:hypothetical protein